MNPQPLATPSASHRPSSFPVVPPTCSASLLLSNAPLSLPSCLSSPSSSSSSSFSSLSSSSFPSLLLTPPPTNSSHAFLLTSIVALLLDGFHALPIRLKILLDRMLDSISTAERDALLMRFGWSPADFARGYISNPPSPHQWQCVPVHTELRLLSLVGSVLPHLAPLVLALRQSALHSLFTFALSGEQHLVISSSSTTTTNTPQQQQQSMNSEGEEQKMAKMGADDEKWRQNGGWAKREREEKKEEEEEDKEEKIMAVDLSKQQQQNWDNRAEEKVVDEEEAEAAKHFVGTMGGERTTIMHRLLPEEGECILSEKPLTSMSDCSTPPCISSSSTTTTGARVRTSRSGGGVKKRVQCPICLKTYCDKGALKIHNSAVHLKETHFCTVKGCERAFSSRRSRNRHSLNSNMHAVLLTDSGTTAEMNGIEKGHSFDLLAKLEPKERGESR